MVANAMVAARLLKLQLDPSFRGEDMRACDVICNCGEGARPERQDPIFGGKGMHARDVIGNSGEGAQPERQNQAETPLRKLAHINGSDSDNEGERKNKRDVLIGRLERAVQDVQSSVCRGARAGPDGSLEMAKLRSLESIWHYYNEIDEDDYGYYGELNELDDAALDLIGTYIELQDDVDCDFGDEDSEICRLIEHLGAQEIWMTRDFLDSVRQCRDDQAYGAEVLRDFYGDDYW
eukprot:CAMPEP_0179245156 /NCGR_PEP_ID=MMETSP0797-20121207/18427_1 /TAXON_ID=47934 /ORGANISM="Dinophysis acuminata, Strain DAEP01" /LENGTH=234 /DNA_ID=CAMNT_0020952693 /DNA_START=89 /DNA_END=793 /DNA_ORIENTATION=-